VLSLEDRKKFGALVAHAWAEPELRTRYEQAAPEVLAEFGISLNGCTEIPELPELPSEDVRDEELAGVYGGINCCGTFGTLSCPGPYTVGTAGCGHCYCVAG